MNDVTQSDRENGATLLENRLKEAGLHSFEWAENVINEVRQGKHDDHYYVQNSAAHRLSQIPDEGEIAQIAQSFFEHAQDAHRLAAAIVAHLKGEDNAK